MKVQKKKGFTLAELLIVVAVIAVLVAISVPIFLSKLEKSREATDVANMRSAKAAVVVQLLESTTNSTMYYDADAGILRNSSSGIHAYGKGTSVVGDAATIQDNYKPGVSYSNGIIRVDFDNEASNATLMWVSPSDSNHILSGTSNVYVGK